MEELNKLMNEINWLVSLLVAIPLSIAGNLLTPLLQNWKAGKSRNAARNRLQALERELRQAAYLASDPSRLNTYLLSSLLLVIVLFAFPNVFGGLFAVIYVFPGSMDGGFLTRAIAASSGMLNALFNLMAIVRAVEAMKVRQRVGGFAEYEAETRALIEKLRTSSA